MRRRQALKILERVQWREVYPSLTILNACKRLRIVHAFIQYAAQNTKTNKLKAMSREIAELHGVLESLTGDLRKR